MEFVPATWDALGGGCSSVAGHIRLRDRAIARLRAQQLDRALAGGERSDKTEALALRATRLTAGPFRRSIAKSYRHILRQAREDPKPSRARIVPSRDRVIAARHELTEVARALTQPGPVAARGVAQALLLLRDGTGPMYNRGSEACLRTCLAIATENLELTPAGDRV